MILTTLIICATVAFSRLQFKVLYSIKQNYELPHSIANNVLDTPQWSRSVDNAVSTIHFNERQTTETPLEKAVSMLISDTLLDSAKLLKCMDAATKSALAETVVVYTPAEDITDLAPGGTDEGLNIKESIVEPTTGDIAAKLTLEHPVELTLEKTATAFKEPVAVAKFDTTHEDSTLENSVAGWTLDEATVKPILEEITSGMSSVKATVGPALEETIVEQLLEEPVKFLEEAIVKPTVKETILESSRKEILIAPIFAETIVELGLEETTVELTPGEVAVEPIFEDPIKPVPEETTTELAVEEIIVKATVKRFIVEADDSNLETTAEKMTIEPTQAELTSKITLEKIIAKPILEKGIGLTIEELGVKLSAESNSEEVDALKEIIAEPTLKKTAVKPLDEKVATEFTLENAVVPGLTTAGKEAMRDVKSPIKEASIEATFRETIESIGEETTFGQTVKAALTEPALEVVSLLTIVKETIVEQVDSLVAELTVEKVLEGTVLELAMTDLAYETPTDEGIVLEPTVPESITERTALSSSLLENHELSALSETGVAPPEAQHSTRSSNSYVSYRVLPRKVVVENYWARPSFIFVLASGALISICLSIAKLRFLCARRKLEEQVSPRSGSTVPNVSPSMLHTQASHPKVSFQLVTDKKDTSGITRSRPVLPLPATSLPAFVPSAPFAPVVPSAPSAPVAPSISTAPSHPVTPAPSHPAPSLTTPATVTPPRTGRTSYSGSTPIVSAADSSSNWRQRKPNTSASTEHYVRPLRSMPSMRGLNSADSSVRVSSNSSHADGKSPFGHSRLHARPQGAANSSADDQNHTARFRNTNPGEARTTSDRVRTPDEPSHAGSSERTGFFRPRPKPPTVSSTVEGLQSLKNGDMKLGDKEAEIASCHSVSQNPTTQPRLRRATQTLLHASTSGPTITGKKRSDKKRGVNDKENKMHEVATPGTRSVDANGKKKTEQ